MEWKCEFYDTENLDGYFSGVLFLYINNKRYIFSFGYDSYGDTYSNEEIANVYTKNYYLLKNEMKLQIGI